MVYRGSTLAPGDMPAVDIAAERQRHWEVARYLGDAPPSPPITLDCGVSNDPPPAVYDPSKSKLAKDPVLTALAQLGVYRIGVERAFISLIDSNCQYIIAEASRDSPLLVDEGDNPALGLAFGSGAVNIAFSVCERTISVFTHRDGRFNVDTANVLANPELYLIRDFREHEMFKDRPYITGWPHMKCYIEVPLRNSDGVVLGSYCVIDDKTRPDMTEQELGIIREIASTIVRHLEVVRQREEHVLASRLLKGLDSFIQGKADSQGDAANDSSQNQSQTSNSSGQHTTSSDPPSSPLGERTVKSSVTGDTTNQSQMSCLPGQYPTKSDPLSAPNSSKDAVSRGNVIAEGLGHNDSAVSTPEVNLPRDVRRNFARAAKVLRESMNLTGVVFLDAFPSSFQSRTKKSSANRTQASALGTDIPQDSTPKVVHADDSQAYPLSTRLHLDLDSDVYGVHHAVSQSRFSVPSDVLQGLIETYPAGHTFHFDDQGLVPVKRTDCRYGDRPDDHGRLREIASVLPLFFPRARSIIFAPLWVPSREACYAGCFGWSIEPRRVLTLTDLNFFVAFGHSVMAEIARLETLASDRAKSDFISSISHELRSPLHGILGSADLLLLDSAATPAQQQMISMIGSCGKTLLDTLNHLLDFAKIIQFTRNTHDHVNPSQSATGETSNTGNAVSEFNLSTLVEEVVDAVIAGDRYRHGMAMNHTRKPDSGIPSVLPVESEAQASPVVLLSIDKSADVMISSQSGAIRRILMNLLGNSLKYTKTGYIEVDVHAEPVADSDESRNQYLNVTMSVKDSGKGISKEYLQRKLYMPFAQENALAEGIGLGLSIVKQIADSLGASVDINSQVGIGTEIIISAPVKAVSTAPDKLDLSPNDLEVYRELRLGILAPPGLSGGTATATKTLDAALSTRRSQAAYTASRSEAILARQLEQWFEIPTTAEPSLENPRVDIFIVKADQLRSFHPDDLERHALLVLDQSYGTQAEYRGKPSHWLHFVPTSVGPRRMAHALSLFVNRARLEEPNSISHDALPTKAIQPHADPTDSSPTATASLANLSLEDATTSALIGGELISHNDPYVLVVDDNPINLNILVMYLRKLGCEFATATNGREALDTYTSASRNFTTVLMDVSMPIMDGFSATRAIRNYEIEKGLTPATIVALTGLGDSDARKEAQASGVDLFWAKPVPMKQVKSLIIEG